MIIKIDMNSETALYEQICNSIVEGIATSKLLPEENMPTVRKLSVDLGINLHTVNKAYNILKQKGYLSVHRSRGVMVNQKDAYTHSEDFTSSIKTAIKPMLSECLARGMAKDEINQLVSNTIGDIFDEGEV